MERPVDLADNSKRGYPLPRYLAVYSRRCSRSILLCLRSSSCSILALSRSENSYSRRRCLCSSSRLSLSRRDALSLSCSRSLSACSFSSLSIFLFSSRSRISSCIMILRSSSFIRYSLEIVGGEKLLLVMEEGGLGVTGVGEVGRSDGGIGGGSEVQRKNR